MSFRYPKQLRFQCTRCALCCGDTRARARHILLLKDEVEGISQATARPVQEFAVEIKGREPYVYEMKKTAEEGKCFFLSDHICTIYELRPLICRFYPFELTRSRDQRHAFLCTKECPGVGEGKLLEKEYFKGLFRQVRDKLLEL